jgi:hypothetical protein
MTMAATIVGTTSLSRRSTDKIEATVTKSGLEGAILDCDAHLYLEPEVMAEILGPIGGGFVLDFLRQYRGSEDDLSARAKNRADIWGVKGISALGAIEAEERVEALDRTGIRAALLFPNTTAREVREAGPEGMAACRRYNDYAIEWTRRTGNRARAVCQVNMANVGAAIAELDRVLAKGAQGILMGCAQPPAGLSPAHEDWDPFWARLEEAGVPNLSFTFLNRNVPMPYVPVGIDLIDQWRQIGVNVEHQQLETSAYLSNLRGLNYDAGLDFACDFMDEPNIQLAKYLSADASPINYAGYNDPKLDELYEQQARETDPARRAETVREFEEHLFQESYIVPSIWWHRIIVHLDEMKNWYMSPSHYLNQDLQDVWLDQ